jgi:hypothetical protein
MGLSEIGDASSASRIAQVCNLPLVIGANQSPPGKSPGSQTRCRALFVRRLPGDPDILLANPGDEKPCPISRGQATRPDSVCWQPLRSMASQCLPTCCCKSLGPLELYTGSAHSRCVNQESSHSPMTHRCDIVKGRYALLLQPFIPLGIPEKDQATLKFHEAQAPRRAR